MKTGPGTNRKWPPSRMLAPVTSLGSRSGVPWTRPKSRPRARANARARSVLPTPGTSSIRAWPSASSAIARRPERLVGADDGHGHAVAQGTAGPGAVAGRSRFGPGRRGGLGVGVGLGVGHARRSVGTAGRQGYVPGPPRVHSPERPVCGTMRPMAGRDVLPCAATRASRCPRSAASRRRRRPSSSRPGSRRAAGRATSSSTCTAGAAGSPGPRSTASVAPPSLETSPLTRLLAEVVLRPPDVRHLDAAFQAIAGGPARAVGASRSGSASATPVAAPTCGRSVVLDEVVWESDRRRAGPPDPKHYRCTVCRDQLGGGEQRHGPVDEADLARIEAAEPARPGLADALRDRFPYRRRRRRARRAAPRPARPAPAARPAGDPRADRDRPAGAGRRGGDAPGPPPRDRCRPPA